MEHIIYPYNNSESGLDVGLVTNLIIGLIVGSVNHFLKYNVQ